MHFTSATVGTFLADDRQRTATGAANRPPSPDPSLLTKLTSSGVTGWRSHAMTSRIRGDGITMVPRHLFRSAGDAVVYASPGAARYL